VPELVECFEVGPLGCNCSIVADPGGRDAVVIDPGGDVPSILDVLRTHGLRCVAIVHTHAHFDHILGTEELARETGAPAWLHPGDRFLWDGIAMQGAWFGLTDLRPPPPPQELVDGQTLAVGAGDPLAVLHTPGHTPGSVCFRAASANLLFSGDTLFRMGIGRTDLPGGDTAELMRSIRERLLSLPGETRVVPGHGPPTQIGLEARNNPWLGRL
jgi:glyoxylase-like metal-dependent hydrolase (beta-lactamase superfamily II)